MPHNDFLLTIDKKCHICFARQVPPQPHPVGENADIILSFTGTPNPKTGMIHELSQVKSIIHSKITPPYDHHFLNNTPQFHHTPPTLPNITKALFNDARSAFKNEPSIPVSCHLSTSTHACLSTPHHTLISQSVSLPHIRLDIFPFRPSPINCDIQLIASETDTSPDIYPKLQEITEKTSLSSPIEQIRTIFNSFLPKTTSVTYKNLGPWSLSYHGNDQFQVHYTTSFQGTHQLYSDTLSQDENNAIFGKCTQLHGHRFTLTISLEISENTLTLATIKTLENRLSQATHILNTQDLMTITAPDLCTCENLIDAILSILEDHHIDTVQAIELWETPNNRFSLLKKRSPQGEIKCPPL